VRLDLDDYVGVDIEDVQAVTLDFDHSATTSGHIWLDDLRFE
jgi:hypothetical protein